MSFQGEAPPGFNYAHAEGIHSVAAPIIFAVLYVPLFLYFLRNAIRRPTYVFIMLSLFCIIRVAAFITHAVLAGGKNAGQNLSLLIASLILYSVGFFGLLYSAYILVLDRERLVVSPTYSGIFYRISHSRMLFRLLLSAAVAIGITGTCETFLSTSSSSISTGQSLRKASTIIFLILVLLLAYQTIMLARAEKYAQSEKRVESSMGSRHGTYILAVVCLLLIVREVFLIATVGNLAKQQNEHFWYPLVVVTEFLCVCLLATPGLVPKRSELPNDEV